MAGLILKLIFFINLIILNYCHATPVTTEVITKEKDLKSYLELIKRRTDLTVDPCDDFSKYACGNMDQNPTEKSKHKLTGFVKTMFIDNEPQNESERKVRDFYLSCMKTFKATENDHTKRIQHIFEQIPDIRFYSNENEVTSKDIAKMFLKLHLLGIREEQFNIDIYFSRLQIIAIPRYDESDVENILTAANYIDGIKSIKKFTKKIVDFLSARPKDEDTDYDYIKINVKSIDELKKLLPSNHINWDEIYNGFKDEFGTIKTEITVGNIELLKQLIEIIDTTDKHTFMNYLTLRYIEFLYRMDCSDLDYFYRYAVLSRLWDDNFSDETTVNRFVTFVDDFEKLFNSTFFIKDYVYRKLNSKRNTAKNYKKILPDKVRDDFYKNYNIDVNSFYKNILQMYKGFVKDINNYDYDKIEVQNSDEFRLRMGYNDDTIKTYIKNMPYIHLYSTIAFDFWYPIIRNDKRNFLTDFDLTKDCPNINKESFANDIQYCNTFPSQKLTYLGMLHDSENINSKLHKEKELIESKHIDKDLTDLKKLYFIGLAQYECELGNTKITDNIFKILQNTMEFSEHFKCPANSNMNKTPVCKFEKCKDDIKKYSILMPINSGECYQNIFE